MAGVLAGEVCGESRRWLMGEQDLADTESEISPDGFWTYSQTLELSMNLLEVSQYPERALEDPSPGTVKLRVYSSTNNAASCPHLTHAFPGAVGAVPRAEQLRQHRRGRRGGAAPGRRGGARGRAAAREHCTLRELVNLRSNCSTCRR